MPEIDPKVYVSHYRESIKPSKIKTAFERVKKRAIQNAISSQLELKFLAESIKDILCKHGVMPDVFQFYISYAYELHFVVARFEWLTDRIREHKIIRLKAETRGMNPTVLDAIDASVRWYGGRTK